MSILDPDILINPERIQDLEQYLIRVLGDVNIDTYETLNDAIAVCIKADNLPGIDMVTRYYGRDDPNYAELLRIGATQRMETIIHLYNEYCYCDLYMSDEALLYSDFVNLTSNNSDPRVARFVDGLKEFITEDGYIPYYDAKKTEKKILKGPPDNEAVQKLIRLQNLITKCCDPIKSLKSARAN